MSQPNPKLIRYALFFLGIMGLALTVGFLLHLPLVTMLIPWELDRLATIFLASIAAAAAFPILWIALSGEYAALTGGGVDFGVTFAGFAGFSFAVYASNPRQSVLLFGIYCLVGFLVTVGMTLFGLRHSFRDSRPTPRLARFSFALFAATLILVGSLLVLKQPNVFPWQLTPQQSVLYGWIFLGAAMYFIYGFLRPVWGNAQGQLLGFLAYDVILIAPLLGLLLGGQSPVLPNLLIYLFIVIYSGLLAIYYLFLNRATRISFSAAPAHA